MIILTWIIGIAITAWIGAMGIGALLRTESAKRWFGDMLKQGPILMRINGIGLLIIAAIIGMNLVLPAVITTVSVKWALFGTVAAQLSTLFMQVRGGASRAAMAAPVTLIVLAVIYWFIRT